MQTVLKHTFTQFFIVFATVMILCPALLKAQSSVKENMLQNKRGFFTCSGGTQVPLFKQDCTAINLQRVSFGGGISYEAQCKDSSGLEYVVACIAFSFEPDASLNIPSGVINRP